MSMLTKSPALRWTVPAVAAAAVIGGGAVVGTLTASADPNLPPRSAAELLVDLQTARMDGLSGTVVQRADLGLPSLPVQGDNRSSDLSSLISGKHTLRVWYAGPDQARVALLGRLGESDIILNKQDIWVWSSQDNTYAHKRLPGSPEQQAEAHQLPFTPQQAAEAALAAIDPSTVVSTAGSARVAGRDAYEMVLAPRDSASLVGQVRFAIDAQEHVPLRVQVYAKGATNPALEVAFTAIDFDRPDAAQFAFTPPPGAKEEQIDKLGLPLPLAGAMAPAGGKVVGKGWTSVLVGPAPTQFAGGGQGEVGGLLQILPPVSGSWGSGRLLSGKLFSVLITDDGRTLFGLVSPERLYQVAADPAAKVPTR
jgi:outer membrane lipoprotein-sorting protein